MTWGPGQRALTYYLLFALFPLMVFVSTLLGILKLDVDNIVSVSVPAGPRGTWVFGAGAILNTFPATPAASSCGSA